MTIKYKFRNKYVYPREIDVFNQKSRPRFERLFGNHLQVCSENSKLTKSGNSGHIFKKLREHRRTQ